MHENLHSHPPTNKPERPWRFGLRGKMRATFALITLLVVSAVFVAWSSYRETDRSLDEIVHKSIPLMTELANVSHLTQQILTLTPTILLADDMGKLERAAADFSQKRAQFTQSLAALDMYPSIASEMRQMRMDVLDIQSDTFRLLSAQQERIRLATSYEIVHEQIEVIHQEYRLLSGAKIASSSTAQRFLLHTNQFLTALSHLNRAKNQQQLEIQMEQMRPILHRMSQSLGEQGIRPIQQAAERIVRRLQELAYGDNSISALRRREITADKITNSHLGAIRDTEQRLSTSLCSLMDDVKQHTKERRAITADRLGQSQILLLILGIVCTLGTLFLTFVYLGHSVLKRINRLGATMRAIAGGDIEHPIDPGPPDELGDMAMDLSIFRDVMARNNHIATHDLLTGLGNRALLDAFINRSIQHGDTGSLLYFNLDGLRDIIETFGHDTGDRVLRILADRLSKSVRPADIPTRIGGQRFVVAAPALIEPSNIQTFVSRLTHEMRRPIRVEELELSVDPFAGIACYPEHGQDAETLMHHADVAMRTRLDDRNNLDGAIYTPDIGHQADHIKQIRKDLKLAIDRGDFLLHFQPKMRIATGQIIGAEALVRWNHPERGAINPADFIPMAERSGLILPLGRWILQEACRQAKIWLDMGCDARWVAVNISPVQFLRDDMVQAVQDALSKTGLPAEMLELEITEGVFVKHEESVLERMSQLRAMGIRLSVDDFGTGYSSLSYLKKLPVNTLKIDQSFVRNIEPNNEDARICRAIIRLAHDLGLDVVAEGIEWQSHIDFLNAESCDIGQGYLISRPLPASDIPAFISKWKSERQTLREVPTSA